MTLLVTLNHARHSCRALTRYQRPFVQPVLVQYHHSRLNVPKSCRCYCSSIDKNHNHCPVLVRIKKNPPRVIVSKQILSNNVQYDHPFYFNPWHNQRILGSWTERSAYQYRGFHSSRSLFDKEPSSKVEQTVNALKEEAAKKEGDKAAEVTEVKPKDQAKTVSVAEVPKRSLGKRIWDEIVHYYHGFRLLFIDIKIASRLLFKSMNGADLSRREYRQLTRTTADIFRLVPFSIFIIVPFMELLLPVFLKFFPGMLPSTFQSAKDKVSFNDIDTIDSDLWTL